MVQSFDSPQPTNRGGDTASVPFVLRSHLDVGTRTYVRIGFRRRIMIHTGALSLVSYELDVRTSKSGRIWVLTFSADVV